MPRPGRTIPEVKKFRNPTEQFTSDNYNRIHIVYYTREQKISPPTSYVVKLLHMGTSEGFQPRNTERSSVEQVIHVASKLWAGAVWIDRNIIKNLYHDTGENGFSKRELVERSRSWLAHTGKDYVAKHVKKRISRRSTKERIIKFRTQSKQPTSSGEF